METIRSSLRQYGDQRSVDIVNTCYTRIAASRFMHSNLRHKLGQT